MRAESSGHGDEMLWFRTKNNSKARGTYLGNLAYADEIGERLDLDRQWGPREHREEHIGGWSIPYQWVHRTQKSRPHQLKKAQTASISRPEKARQKQKKSTMIRYARVENAYCVDLRHNYDE